MTPTRFVRLNDGWNADPNVPEPSVSLDGEHLVLACAVNAAQFPRFQEGQRLRLVFSQCWRYRLGGTNDEGWYRGQCRFSGIAPKWGEFYEVEGDLLLARAPDDWKAGPVEEQQQGSRHFLFYLRDETFECDALDWQVSLPATVSP